MTKRRVFILVLVLVALSVFGIALTQPFFVHRLFTKAFTAYELSLLKYPDSQLIQREISPTSKITMATYYTFHSPDDLESVLDFMEQQRPGYVQLQGSYVIVEPTFRNTTCANETLFRGMFHILELSAPCIKVSIYPSATGGTSIRISENWVSKGFPAWLRTW
jgi:hypothetical protein